MEFLDSFSSSAHSRNVIQTESSVSTELMYVRPCWSTNTGSIICRSP